MSLRTATAATGVILGLAALALTAAPARSAPAPPAATPPVTADTVAARALAAAPADAARRAAAPVPVAHRGASAYAPENTLAAVDRAGELGIAWVEIDVQRTKDGKLVVMHDTTLNRTTDVEEVFPGRSPWKVADFTAEETARLDAGSWFGASWAGEQVPTFEQALRRLSANQQNLLLEIKRPDLYPGIEEEILAELADEGWLDRQHIAHRLVVQSFDAASVRTAHQLRPQIKTGFLGTPAVADLPSYAVFCDQINPRHQDLSTEYVRSVHAVTGAHGRPLELYTWTVNDAATATAVTRMGVDGIISNTPDLVRDTIGGWATP